MAPPKSKPGAAAAQSTAAAPKAAAPTASVTPEAVLAATGSADPDLGLHLVNQAAQALCAPSSLSEEARRSTTQAALAALKGLAPRDELEGLLATQMVATHNAARECLRRAMLAGQSFEGRDQNLKHAVKLKSLYVRQVETLDKRRGGGQQKITVEHVTVNAGGQAIVDAVAASAAAAAGAARPATSAPPALTHDPAPLVPDLNATPLTVPVPARRRSARRDGLRSAGPAGAAAGQPALRRPDPPRRALPGAVGGRQAALPDARRRGRLRRPARQSERAETRPLHA
jgi:hypothetical protein